MAERSHASIIIGGKISAAEFATLIQLAKLEGLSIEWGGPELEAEHHTSGESLSLYAFEVVGAQFAALETWCVESGLPFSRWSAGYAGSWLAGRCVFRGVGECMEFATDDDGHVVASREVVDACGSMAALRAWFDAADFEVPPLVIVPNEHPRDHAGQEDSGEGEGELGSHSSKGTSA